MKEDAFKENAPRKALIYCRVSTKKQKEEGHGLDSQEQRCRQYAALKEYTVEEVFPDDITGEGDFVKRKGMVALLAYMDARPRERFVVIFDDLKRYARDTEFHLKLRRIMEERGATRECLNFNFEDTPEGEFNETIQAAVGTLERKQNARQSKQKMRARVENGYYCFAPVLGYEYVKQSDKNKMLAPREPQAAIVREALKGFAGGRFQAPIEVARFLGGFSCIPKNKHGEVRLQTVIDMLKRPLYAGYISVPKWKLHLLPGKHEPLISFEIWQKIQDRLEGVSRAPARKDISRDFVLRGHVCCADCGGKLTAGWSKGRSKHYPYYNCQTPGCPSRKKSIRRADIEGAFQDLLETLQPVPELLSAFKALMSDLWEKQHSRSLEEARRAKSEAAAIEKQIAALVNRIVSTDNERVAKAYEAEIEKLDRQKVGLIERAKNSSVPVGTFDDVYRTACAFLANPWKIWNSGVFELQIMLLRMLFPGHLEYCRFNGYRTAPIAEPLKLTTTSSDSNLGLVRAAGLEPARPCGRQILSLLCLPISPRPHRLEIAARPYAERRPVARRSIVENAKRLI